MAELSTHENLETIPQPQKSPSWETSQMRKPYTEHTIERTTTYVFSAGKQVYELVAPDGMVYIMQSYAQIVDSTLSEESLATLASRLTLPEQWHYHMRTLDQEYVMQVTGEAHVIQDDLENTYQRATS